MILRNVQAVYRKDLLETLRDRRTLLFVMVVPALTVFLLTVLGTVLAKSFVESLVTRRVVVVATEETERAYHELAHRAFLRTEPGLTMQRVSNPLLGLVLPSALRPLVQNEDLRTIAEDPEAYARWARGLAANLEAGILSEASSTGLPAASDTEAIPEGFLQAGSAFFQRTIRGVGMIDWRRPESIPEANLPAQSAVLPSLREHPHGRVIQAVMKDRNLDIYLSISLPQSGLLTRPFRGVQVDLHHDHANPSTQEAALRLRDVLEAGGDAIVAERLRRARQPAALINPLTIHTAEELRDPRRVLASALAGIIPYFILLFAYIGAMFPAIDLGAGEKERNTLETLLLAPVGRLDIALGKFLVVMTTALASCAIGIGALLAAALFILPPGALAASGIDLSPLTLLALMALAIPVACIFSGIFLGASLFARSFKEAQNYLSPLGIVLTLPPAYAILPWAELNTTTCLVPLVNTSLVAREFILGNFQMGYYGLTLASSIAVAAGALVFCVWQFHRESVLFRT